MLRAAYISPIVVLVVLCGTADAQSLTFTSRDPLPASTKLWVSMELRASAPVKVEFISGNEPFAPSVQFGEKLPVDTKMTSLTRPIAPGQRMEIRYSPSDRKLVGRVGVSNKPYPDGTAFGTTKIVSVLCDTIDCLVCYELQEESTVDFDSFLSQGSNPIRNNFDNGVRAPGRREAKWDQNDDKPMRVVDGDYVIKLTATVQGGFPTTESPSPVFHLRVAPPPAKKCP